MEEHQMRRGNRALLISYDHLGLHGLEGRDFQKTYLDEVDH
jgi:hypothetical protein